MDLLKSTVELLYQQLNRYGFFFFCQSLFAVLSSTGFRAAFSFHKVSRQTRSSCLYTPPDRQYGTLAGNGTAWI